MLTKDKITEIYCILDDFFQNIFQRNTKTQNVARQRR